MEDQKYKVLIIDDSEVLRLLLYDFLKSEGYEVFQAENGKEGLALVEKVSPLVILLDLFMPKMDGYKFLEKIKPSPTDPFLITVVTGSANDDDEKKCYDLGVHSFLRKPINMMDLRCITKRSVDLLLGRKKTILETEKHMALAAELKEKKMDEMLIQTEKMASLGVMAAGVAHDVNNPLNVAKGDIYLIKRDFSNFLGFLDYLNTLSFPQDILQKIEKKKEEEDLCYTIESIHQKISRCEKAMSQIQDIVAGLKGFSRAEEEGLNHIDLNSEIEGALEMIPKKYKQNIEIEKKFSNLPTMLCYGKQLNQIFINLAINSFQEMKEGGHLLIETSQDDKNVYIQYCDTGGGIPESKLTTIFDPFYTTKPIGQGTGLGLSICASIAKKHMGDITACNNKEKGATFTITLKKNELQGK